MGLNLLIPRIRLVKPRGAVTLVRTQSLTYSALSSYAFTIGVTPVQGNLMIFTVGGVQSRTVSISGSGWTKADTTLLPNSVSIFYKFAGAGETTSITFTMTGGTLQGTVCYMEVTNMDTVRTSGVTASQGFTGLSVTLPTTLVSAPGFLISVHAKSATALWTVNNGWTAILGIANRMNTAYKIIDPKVVPYSESFTWTNTGASETGVANLFGFISNIYE